ncbi:MAG: family 10 glycosylhydrolase [Verrucomicrobia bacterium]|nr:family 10 glycosylhydrolase [Verrucomicrobiota bacterium]
MNCRNVKTLLCAGLLLAILADIQAQDSPALKQLRETRKQLAHKQRRVIFNNDGCDALYLPKDEKLTIEKFLDKRTTPLKGTQVDAIAYCTISSGFSFFTHRTKVGAVLTRQPGDYGIQPNMRNITQELADMGTDCLQAVVEFAHKNKMECFWSMRMNDTHDAEYRPDKPYLLYPQLKMDHPDWLVSDPVKRSRYGRWSSVDYARPEIRDLAFRFIEEVCQNYDVDGVELDFFRHLCFFKSTAHGGRASQAERDMMTDLLRRVRAMTEEVGLKRGRPILVMVRATDSVDFNRDMGLDVERWLQDGLFDMLATTCYFRLNPWETSVALGHKYGVPVYPCISDSRVKGEDRFRRGSVESYRGQALEAWAAGADGIHLFNLFDVFGGRSPVFKEVGDPKALRTMTKLYFVTVRDGKPDSWLAGGSKYRTLLILTPAYPKTITASKALSLDLAVGEDFADGTKAQATLHLQMPTLRNVHDVCVKLNGHELSGGKLAKDWLDLNVNPAWIRKGVNQIAVAVNPQPAHSDAQWTVAYEADKLPAKPWTRDSGSVRTEERLANGALTIADRGTVAGDYHYYRYPWGADPAGKSVVEARVKVISGLSRIIITNGDAQERLELQPDRIELWSRKTTRYTMDTTTDFHVYRIVTQGKDIKVYVDGELRLNAPGAYVKTAVNRNELCFGASDSTNVGEACWDYVRARVDSQSCQDLVLRVAYPKK